jgi:DNA-binding GntR family transcriptional regulator
MRDLDNSNQAPYRQAADAIRDAIEAGEYPPGAMLPSMADMAMHFGVSRMTIQAAVRLLKDEGRVVSRQGAGVYVREPPVDPERDYGREIDALRVRVTRLERLLLGED